MEDGGGTLKLFVLGGGQEEEGKESSLRTNE